MRRGTFALLALLACGTTFRPPPAAPADARERRRAEAAACRDGRFPPWLDDGAVRAAVDYDHRQAQASAHNESFHGATFTPQPPPAPRPDSRTQALLDERTEFQRWCEGSKKPVR